MQRLLARILSCAVVDLEGVVVEVEVDSGQGLPWLATPNEPYCPCILSRLIRPGRQKTDHLICSKQNDQKHDDDAILQFVHSSTLITQ